MEKTAMVCPFSNKACTECALFRGRHHYLNYSKQHRGFIDEQEKYEAPRFAVLGGGKKGSRRTSRRREGSSRLMNKGEKHDS